jgi:predicted transport protein
VACPALVNILGERVNVTVHPREDERVVRQLRAVGRIGHGEVDVLIREDVSIATRRN